MDEPTPDHASEPEVAEPSDDTTRPVPQPHPSAVPGGPRRRHGRWILLGVVVAVVSLMSAVLAFGLSRDPTLIRSPLVGRPAPDFSLRTLTDGARISLSKLRGQVVVVNFWASWCAACREEHAALLAVWDRYRDQGVVIVGIDYQDQPSAAVAFMRELGGDWPVVEDPDGRVALAYGVYGVPETFFIDRNGLVRYKRIGPSSYELLIDQIQGLLDQS